MLIDWLARLPPLSWFGVLGRKTISPMQDMMRTAETDIGLYE
jgi:hypothetical protein